MGSVFLGNVLHWLFLQFHFCSQCAMLQYIQHKYQMLITLAQSFPLAKLCRHFLLKFVLRKCEQLLCRHYKFNIYIECIPLKYTLNICVWFVHYIMFNVCQDLSQTPIYLAFVF